MRLAIAVLSLAAVGCATSSSGRASSAGPEGARESLRTALLACGERSREACLVAASKLESGEGAPADARRAASAWQASCALGEPRACALLAFRLERGEGGYPLDRAKAAGLYRHACDLDEDVGCVGYGRALLAGWAGKPDPERAVLVWTSACARGKKLGCAVLGKLLVKVGRPHEAGLLYRRACVLGLQEACNEPEIEGTPDDDATPPGAPQREAAPGVVESL